MIDTQIKPQDTKAPVVKPTDPTAVKEVIPATAPKDATAVKTAAK